MMTDIAAWRNDVSRHEALVCGVRGYGRDMSISRVVTLRSKSRIAGQNCSPAGSSGSSLISQGDSDEPRAVGVQLMLSRRDGGYPGVKAGCSRYQHWGGSFTKVMMNMPRLSARVIVASASAVSGASPTRALQPPQAWCSSR